MQHDEPGLSGVRNTDIEQTWQIVWTLCLTWTDLIHSVRVSGIAGTLFANMADFSSRLIIYGVILSFFLDHRSSSHRMFEPSTGITNKAWIKVWTFLGLYTTQKTSAGEHNTEHIAEFS